MTVQKRLVAVGLGIQTERGTPAAQPTFWAGVKGGKPVNWDISEDAIEVTGEDPLWTEVDRTSVVPGGEFEGLVHPKMAGALLYGALGAVASSGVAAPFTHVFTPDNDVPYLTFFGRAFGGDYISVADCKFDSLELAFENAGHITASASLMGLGLTWGTTAFVPENDESLGGIPLFRAGGGTFKFDPASDTPIERPAISGSLSINNSAEAVPQAASVQPSDVAPSVKDIEVSLTMAPDDLSDIRKALTGSAAGTVIGNVPVIGSFEWLFVIDDDTDLKLEASRLQAVIEMPDADPSGGFLEVEVSGKVLQPLTGAGLIATLRNDVETYEV